MKHSKLFKMIKLSVVLLSLLMICRAVPPSDVSAFAKKKKIDSISSLDIREGDFIFQHLSVELTQVIADVTDSPYSHCGIIIKEKGRWLVLEAIGPVIKTPLNQWIHRGVGSKITIVRLKDQYQPEIQKIIQAALGYLGRPYDIQYQWDDEKIYCSELIYKAALKGAGLKLAAFRQLGELNWRPHEAFIRRISDGDLPLNRKMITPDDLVQSTNVNIVYSTFK